MTVVALELPDDLAESLQALSLQARSSLIASALRASLSKIDSTTAQTLPLRPRNGAELLKVLNADGLLAGYGDPTEDAIDLAQRLREQFSQR